MFRYTTRCTMRKTNIAMLKINKIYNHQQNHPDHMKTGMRQQLSLQAGFSLMELSIVLAIIAIIIAGGINLVNSKTAQQKISNSHTELQEIADSLSYFIAENSRLPCPARLDVQRGNAEFGREATDCADSTPPSGLTRVEYPAASGKYVRIGGVPFYALGLQDEYLADAWYKRYLYAVPESFISTVSDSDTGIITVLDGNATSIADDIAWVLLSHGPTGKGAYSAKGGVVATACSGSDKDGENCDADGIFTDAPYNDGDISANFFDDIILWGDVASLYEANSSLQTTTCTGGDTNGTYNSSCYAVFNTSATWSDAEAACVSWGGHLASITSAAEQSYITSLLTTKTWIGLNDISVEGSWEWVADGSPLGSYTNWGPGEPSALASDCVRTVSSWEAGDCPDSLPYICEKPI